MKQVTLLFLAILFLSGCTKETLTDHKTAVAEIHNSELKQYKAPYEIRSSQERNSCYWTEIAAGSNDELSSAIANACEGGVIYLKSGTHTESEMLTISKSVKIIGESGAILKIKTNLAPYTEDFLQPIVPGIHIYNAPGSLIQDLEIQAVDGEGGTGILIENSPYTGIMRNVMPNFQFALMVEKSDFTTIMLNEIVASSAWLTGGVEEVNSIIISTGESCYISDNDVSNAAIAIWACSSYSTAERNNIHGNFIGLLLCNAPVYFLLPSGEVAGSDKPGNHWKVRNNTATDNLTVGYLVIDGANANLLRNNAASGNGDYDIELASESDRFGFTVPESYNNTVFADSYQNISIKKCGTNNTVHGGQLVDNSLEPCN